MNLSAFLKGNKKKKENIHYAASESFVDEEGNVIEWEIKALSAKQDEAIRDSCTKKVAVQGRKGVTAPELDTNAYLGKMAANSVVFPNLNDAQLQDSYGVMGAEELIKEMLAPGEYQELLTKIQKLNGYDQTFEEKVEEVKN